MKKKRTALLLTLTVLLLLAVGLFVWHFLLGGNAQQYKVTASETEHATLRVSRGTLPSGRNLTVTVQPEKGYRTAFVLLQEGSNVHEMEQKTENKYRMRMPADDVTVSAVILPEGSYGIRWESSEPDTEVLAEPSSAPAGQNVQLTIQVPEGKRISSVESDPSEVLFYSEPGSDLYTFTMPEEDVSVRISVGDRVFSDVGDDWFESYVYAAVDRGYMSGTGSGTFDPLSAVTRGQAVQALYSLAGYPKVKQRDLYTDVAKDAWFAKAVVWAEDQEILSGYEDGTFRPEEPITRQQMATALHHFASGILGQDASQRSSLDQYVDRDEVESYAAASVKWAVSRQILNGVNGDTLEPSGSVPRCQMAAMLLALEDEKPSGQVVSGSMPVQEEPAAEEAPETEETPEVTEKQKLPSESLSDVGEDAWYLDGVNFAVSHGYMSPLREGQFVPKGMVTRRQAVRILYALEGKPEVSGTVQYSDLFEDQETMDAVTWASSMGLVTGYANGTFRPDAVITRQQFVAMLYRYASFKGYDLKADASLDAFTDSGEVEDYAAEPLRWAVSNQIVQGSRGVLGPAEELTRAQVACMVHTFGVYRHEE